MSWKCKITCDTCNVIQHELEHDDIFTLIMRSEVAILSCHVQPPCSIDHKLSIHYDTESKGALLGLKKHLHIECLKCIQSKPDIAMFDVDCEPWLVNSAAICFHARHEGHPFHLTYGDFDIKTPCKADYIKYIAT